jgi:hypothetical protein
MLCQPSTGECGRRARKLPRSAYNKRLHSTLGPVPVEHSPDHGPTETLFALDRTL